MCSEPAIRAPFSGWASGVFRPRRHEARHFGFRDGDFLAPIGGEADVGDGVVGVCWSWAMQS